MSIPSLLELLTDMTGPGIGSADAPEIGLELLSPITETDGIGKIEGLSSSSPTFYEQRLRSYFLGKNYKAKLQLGREKVCKKLS